MLPSEVQLRREIAAPSSVLAPGKHDQDTVVFNAAISSCEKAQQWPNALALLQQLGLAVRFGCPPPDVDGPTHFLQAENPFLFFCVRRIQAIQLGGFPRLLPLGPSEAHVGDAIRSGSHFPERGSGSFGLGR